MSTTMYVVTIFSKDLYIQTFGPFSTYDIAVEFMVSYYMDDDKSDEFYESNLVQRKLLKETLENGKVYDDGISYYGISELEKNPLT